MKRKLTVILMSVFIGSFFSFCNTDKDDETPLPDAVLNITITGAINDVISLTLAENVDGPGDAYGSFLPTEGLFAMSVLHDENTSMLALFYNSGSFQTGTYDLTSASGFTNASPDHGDFFTTAGTMTISETALHQGDGIGVGDLDEYFVDGSFTATMETNETPPQQIQLIGTFTGVNIKVF